MLFSEGKAPRLKVNGNANRRLDAEGSAGFAVGLKILDFISGKGDRA